MPETYGFQHPTHPFAVIDIGSNSVRMVIYHALSRVPMPLFNEKYYCGLARNMNFTGRLDAEGVQLAKAALARFARMLEVFGVIKTWVLATAAVRDAEDGYAFTRQIEQEYGLEVNIISGEEEARLAAMGIMASIHQASGIIADLGGGSLELAAIDQQRILSQQSLPLGTLRLANQFSVKAGKRYNAVQYSLKKIDWLATPPAPALYVVGGSFRTLAKMHMRRHKYPIEIVHGYRMSRRQIELMARELNLLSLDEIATLPAIPAKRTETMKSASQLLLYLVQCTKASEVIFSVSGIREGLLYQSLPENIKQVDSLLASAQELGSLAGRKGVYAKELFEWMQPLFRHEPAESQRLRHALCLLSEIAWTIDPNFRAEWAYLRVLQSAIKGVTHRERIMLATALFHRYQNKWRRDFAETKLMQPKDKLWARCVGLTANLAYQLSGGRPGNLHHSRLIVSGDQISLELDAVAKPLRTEIVEKRLDGLGSTFSALSSCVK